MPKNGMLVRITLALAAVAAVAVTATGVASARQANTSVSGAGSTFVSPLVSAWISPAASQIGINMSYNAIGSGGGIAAIQGRTVDFGASDAPLTSDQFPAASLADPVASRSRGRRREQQSSTTSTAADCRRISTLTGAVLANIYLGKITYWDDKAIKAINKGVQSPAHADHRRLALGRLGHDVQLHGLPQQGLVLLEDTRRHRHGRELAGRRGRIAQLGSFRCGEGNERRDRLCRR